MNLMKELLIALDNDDYEEITRLLDEMEKEGEI